MLPAALAAAAGASATGKQWRCSTIRTLEGSGELARYYAGRRATSRPENLVGLPLPKTSEITREQFVSQLRDPLAGEFSERAWWSIGSDPEGRRLPVSNRIRVLVCMRGVPLKIRREPEPSAPEPKPEPDEKDAKNAAQQMMQKANEAAVDSELCLLGVADLPTGAPVTNRFHRSDQSFVRSDMPYMMLVGRIDAADDETCRRMIEDAVAVEKTGLWGRAYVDVSKHFQQGDDWLRGVAALCRDKGIPVVVDPFKDTLPTNYPMTDAALYFGWYAQHVNGPFLAADFRFRRGAVAMHLHSFSALHLRDPARNWCAPLLARGACATIGNVYEPFLGMTHDLQIFAERLLDGHTLVEASYMSCPGLSWMNVVIGDPLYRPFLHIDGGGKKQQLDREFRALRVATMRWGDEPAELEKNLEKAAKSMPSPTIHEALGLRNLAAGDTAAAATFFETARDAFSDQRDRLRQELHLVALDRAAGKKPEAVRRLRDLKLTYAGLPEAAAITGWLNILDPPPPPPAQPGNPGPEKPPTAK
jgi:uncharacterized protein (TIGR03790 family)